MPIPTLQPTPPPVYYPQPNRNVTIVVDAGHGGHDPGTRGLGYCPLPEKSLNLSIATELTKQLRNRGANVVMTRSNDTFIELSDRAAMGDSHGADLFVAVHIDASRNPGASGMTVYMGKRAVSGSSQVAKCISDALSQAGFETRGVRRANYKVLRESNRAAVLVECGFLSNFSDARLLSTPYHRTRIASAIAQGISNYFGW
jgi:N-acetylmuramoyl-L-alanine amidase